VTISDQTHGDVATARIALNGRCDRFLKSPIDDCGVASMFCNRAIARPMAI